MTTDRLFTPLELRVLRGLADSTERFATAAVLADYLEEPLFAVRGTLAELGRLRLVTETELPEDLFYVLTGLGEEQLHRAEARQAAR